MSNDVLFVGPLPPPVHGFATSNAAMLNRIRETNARVVVYDCTPRRQFHIMKLWWSFFRAIRVDPNSEIAVYIGLSGGARQLVDLIFVLIARLSRSRVFIHHHSFAYLDRRPWYSKLFFNSLRDANHLVLCSLMKERLAANYGVNRHAIHVLTNAAFVAPPSSGDSKGAQVFTLGFLSNITRDKGIFEFFEVMKKLGSLGVECRGIVAGPVTKEIEGEFLRELNSIPNTEHIGPVYGNDKEVFLSGLDVLLFPTQYRNEAQPLTILEALSHGVPVCAIGRGCVADMLPASCGRVAESATEFVDEAVEFAKVLSASPGLRANMGDACRYEFARTLAVARENLEQLVKLIVGPGERSE
jgi:glycosyltransferase involved in cell wall biosynthesis